MGGSSEGMATSPFEAVNAVEGRATINTLSSSQNTTNTAHAGARNSGGYTTGVIQMNVHERDQENVKLRQK